MMDYKIIVVPLSAEDGGGYAAYLPDVPGCMSDGETPEEAALNVQDALISLEDICTRHGHSIQPVGDAESRRRAEIASVREEVLSLVQAAATGKPDLERNIRDLMARIERLGTTWFDDRLAELAASVPAKAPKVA